MQEQIDQTPTDNTKDPEKPVLLNIPIPETLLASMRAYGIKNDVSINEIAIASLMLFLNNNDKQ